MSPRQDIGPRRQAEGMRCHESASFARIMGAPAAEQARQLEAWGLGRAALLMMMSPCYNHCFFCASPRSRSAAPARGWIWRPG